jgi:hypothetical protein
MPTRLGTVTRQTSNAYRLVLHGLAAIGTRVLPGKADRNNYNPSVLTALMAHALGQETAASTQSVDDSLPLYLPRRDLRTLPRRCRTAECGKAVPNTTPAQS